MKQVRSGGGWPAIRYTFGKAREAGGPMRLWRAMRSRNACKTCALGMGGQKGGMVNESGHFPEVCKKSLQAMVADLQPAIDPSFFEQTSLDVMREMNPRELESLGRLAHPMIYSRKKDKYAVVSWDHALNRVAEKLKSITPDESFFYFSGRSSNEAGFLLQLFARIYGTNNVNNCSYYCHQASGVGLASSIGSGTATVVLEDLDRTDLVFVIGANPASNHPRLMRTLMQVRRRGGKVVVVNPIRETGLLRFNIPSDPRSFLFGTEIASTYVQPHIGGDLAFLTGVARYVVENGSHDRLFIREHTNGFEAAEKRFANYSWEELEHASGVDRETMKEVADVYGESDHAVFSWAMGITHHAHGTESVQAIANLALLRGMVGKPGAGLMPIRGHSNVQGIGSMGVTPKLKEAVFQRLQTELGIHLPETPGRDTMACMEGAAAGDLQFGLCLGGNLYGSNPDSGFASGALENLDQLVFLSTTMNTGHTRGLARETIILPVLARDEEPEPTTQESMFNFVRLSDGGPARHTGPRSELDVISTLASQVLADSSPINWTEYRNSNRIRRFISRIVPGYEAIDGIDESRQEFQIEGRTFHTPHFATPDGKARFFALELPGLTSPHAPPHGAPHGPSHGSTHAPAHAPARGSSHGSTEKGLRLMTIRSEGQFNTVVYEDHDLYRGVETRNVILIHPEDAAQLDLEHGTTVRVSGPGGVMDDIRIAIFPKIKMGNVAMYFPEANVLLSRIVDPLSQTPAFKGARITITASQR